MLCVGCFIEQWNIDTIHAIKVGWMQHFYTRHLFPSPLLDSVRVFLLETVFQKYNTLSTRWFHRCLFRYAFFNWISFLLKLLDLPDRFSCNIRCYPIGVAVVGPIYFLNLYKYVSYLCRLRSDLWCSLLFRRLIWLNNKSWLKTFGFIFEG